MRLLDRTRWFTSSPCSWSTSSLETVSTNERIWTDIWSKYSTQSGKDTQQTPQVTWWAAPRLWSPQTMTSDSSDWSLEIDWLINFENGITYGIDSTSFFLICSNIWKSESVTEQLETVYSQCQKMWFTITWNIQMSVYGVVLLNRCGLNRCWVVEWRSYFWRPRKS